MTAIPADTAHHIWLNKGRTRALVQQGEGPCGVPFAQGTIHEGQLLQLRLLVVVVVIINRDQQFLYNISGLDQALLALRSDQHVHIVFQVFLRLSVCRLAFLHRSPPSDRYFRPCLCLQLLLTAATGPHDEAEEIVRGVLLNRNIKLFGKLGAHVPPEHWVRSDTLLDESLSPYYQFFTQSLGSGVCSFAVCIVFWLW